MKDLIDITAFVILLTFIILMGVGCGVATRTIMCDENLDKECCKEATSFATVEMESMSVAYQVCMLRKELRENK